jgi:archaellum component FlaC
LASAPIGEIPVLITGDWSDLQDSINAAVQAAEAGAQQIADAMSAAGSVGAGGDISAGIGAASESLSQFGGDAAEVESNLASLDSAISTLDSSFEEISSAGEQADSALTEMSSSFNEVESSAGEVGSALGEAASSMGDLDSSFSDVAASGSEIGDSLGDVDSALGELDSSAEGVDSTLSEVAEGFDGLDGAAESIEDGVSAAADALSTFDSDASGAEGAAGELSSTLSDLGTVDVSGLDDAYTGLSNLADVMPEVANAAGETASAAEELPEPLEEAGEGAGEAAESIGELTESIIGSLGPLGEMVLAVGAGELAFEGLKEVATETVTDFGQFQRAEIALEGFTGSAETATQMMEGLEAIASQDALSMPQLEVAQQRLVALGATLQEVPSILNAIADGAASMNASFDTAAQRFDQITMSGTLSARSLVNLGASLQDIGAVMGDVDAPLAQIKADFLGIEDTATRMDIVMSAIEAAQPGKAQAMAQGVTGAWQQVTNSFEAANVAIGKITDGFTSLTGIVSAIPKFIADIVVEIVGLLKDIADAGVFAVQAVETVVSTVGQAIADVAKGNWSAALSDLKNGASDVANEWHIMTDSISADEAKTTETITSLWGKATETMTLSVDQFNAAFSKGAQSALLAAQQALAGTGDLKTAYNELNTELAQYNSHLQLANSSSDQMADQVVTALNNVNQALANATNGVAKWNTQWQQSAQKAMLGFMEMEDGTKTASSEVSELQNAIDAALVNQAKWSGDTANVFNQLKVALQQAQQAAQTQADSPTLDQIAEKVVAIQVAANNLANKVPADFTAMMQGVDQGVNFSGIQSQMTSMVTKLQNDLQTLGGDFSKMTAQQKADIQSQIQNLQQADAQLTMMNTVMTLLGQNKAMETVSKEAVQLGVAMSQFDEETGQFALSDQQVQTALTNLGDAILKTVIPAMQAGTPASQTLITALQNLGPVGQQWAALLTQDADKAQQAIQGFVSSTQASVGTVSLAFKNLGAVSFVQAQTNVNTYGSDVVKALSGVSDAASLSSGQMVGYENVVLAWANKVWPAIQEGATVSQDVITAVAKISPAFAQAINQGPAAFGQAMVNMKAQVANTFQSVDAAWQVFGQTSENVLNQNQAHMTAALGLMQQQGASLNDQLTGYTKILQNQQLINQQWDQTGQSELATAQTLTQIQLAQFAINNATMGLANEWNTITQAIGTAWQSLEKGLADAIVAGGSLTKVFTQLAQTILEAVVKQALDQMASALITNSGLIQGLGFDMTALGSTAQATQATVASSMAASAASMSTSATTMATAMQGAATAITTANSGMVTGVTGDLSVLGPAFTGMTTQVTASTQSMAAAVTAAASQCDVSLQFFGNSTAASMAQASAATTAAASTMVMDIGAIGAALGALAGIVGDLGQSHMDKVLGQIETNTRYTMIYVGQQSQNLLWCAQQSTMYLGLIHGDIVKGLAGGGSSTPQTAAEAAAAAAALAASQSTGSTATADEGSSSSVDYSDLASDVTATTTAISLTNKLLSSIAITVSEILVMLADTSKTNLSLLMSQMEELVNSDVIQLPLQDIAAALGGTGGLVSQLNTLTATTTTATTATTAAGTAASAAATGLSAVAGATSSVTDGINQMSGAITTTIGTVALTTGEIMAAAAAAGTAATAATTAAQDYTELTGTLTTAAAATATAATNITSASTQLVNAATLAATPGATGSAAILSTSAFVAQNQIPSVTLNVYHTGTLVGTDGMQQLGQMVQKAMVQGLQTRGIRVTR